ncbi:class II aldolase/adducin family protein [Sulfurimonas sp. HSL3-7]|uniref:class II aldolase/adducin family protein n=1 Tax=Sulfonitrofixus jiaomeiensis TaxID=3131938 RepID=UPI0031F74BEA
MKSLFDDAKAATLTTPLQMRVYTSQLLGQSEDLVLHGGGNTSYKSDETLYVKGSGWNLIDIEEPGFSPVDLAVLQEMATRKELSDSQMVKEQRAALRKADAPNPSIEAILHAIIPFAFVDHTHADAIVTISNTPNGKEMLREIYGYNVLLIDYVMPGFILSKQIYEQTRDIDWSALEGIILLNHGLFTFDDDAKRSYEKHIDLVTKAEAYIQANTTLPTKCEPRDLDGTFFDTLIQKVSELRGTAITAVILDSVQACALSKLPDLEEILSKGELTPEHVIRIKPFPAVIDEDVQEGLQQFVNNYRRYFEENADSKHICLDLAPRYAMIKGFGAVAFGKDEKEANVIADIVEHTVKAMLTAEQLGGWKSLKPSDVFDMEYWELEQAKLIKR